MSPKVSVILPTYNRVRSLHAAINSVLSQSFRDLELIIVDDASTENIADLIVSIEDPRLRYIRRHSNGGAAAARNSGLGLARGDYIAFQDSDDVWLPGKLECQLALLERLPVRYGVVTGAKILYQPGGRHCRVVIAPSPATCLDPDEDQFNHMVIENRLSVQCALFRSSVLERERFDPALRADEDWDLAVRVARMCAIYEDSKPVAVGFVSPDSISRCPRPRIAALRILRKHRRILCDRPKERARLCMEIAGYLFRSHKPRRATGFMLAALGDNPMQILSALATVRRRTVGALAASVARIGTAAARKKSPSAE